MKIYKSYMREYGGSALISSIFACLVATAAIVFGFPVGNVMATLTGYLVGVSGIWLITSAFSMYSDNRAFRMKSQWEAAMLNAIQLATAADVYFAGNADAISGFHDIVSGLKADGVKFGFLNEGNIGKDYTFRDVWA